MTHRKRRFPVFWIGVFALLGPTGTAPAQTIVVTAKSVNDLLDDLEYLVKAVAPQDDGGAQAALGALEQFKAGEMVKGLDRARGFGLAVSLPKDFPQGGPPSVVAAVPVTNLGELLDSLKGLGVAVDDQPGVAGFSHKVTAPDGNTNLFVLESKGYALFSLVPDGADRLKALDLSTWRPKGRTESTLSARVRLSEIPDALKDQFLTQVEAQARQDQERKPNEKEADYKARIAGEKLTIDTFRKLVQEGDSLALDLDVSRKTSEMSLEASVTAQPGTEMAKTLRSFGGQRSRFEGLGGDTVLSAWARFPVAKALRDAISEAAAQGMKEGVKELKTEEERKLFNRFTDLMKSQLNAPEVDLGVSIQVAPPAGAGDRRHVLLAGLRLQDGREAERLFRDAIAQAKPPENIKMMFDVAKSADGTAIHQLTGLAGQDDPKLKDFGKPSLFFSFRQDAVVGAFGEDGLAALRRALDGPPAPARTESDGPVVIVAHMAGLGTFAGENQEALRRATAEVFKGDGPRRDRVSLTLKGEGDSVRIRLALDVPALKLLAILGNEKKKADGAGGRQ